jgi:putative ABC transport system ATP-binding protein
MPDLSETTPKLMLEARDLTLSYGQTRALNGVSMSVAPGESVAVMGASGSGKSSLLHCLAGVIAPNSGSVHIDCTDLTGLSDRSRSRVRLERIGVVFQFGDLVPELSLIENVMLPLQLLGQKTAAARDRALELLTELGIPDLADSRAGEVSGGQAQRAAVARAMVHQPAIVLADEPTGSLDSFNAEEVMDAMIALTRTAETALVVVTHDNRVASHLDRLITLHDGAVLNSGLGAEAELAAGSTRL